MVMYLDKASQQAGIAANPLAGVHNNRERELERSLALHQMYSESNVFFCLKRTIN